MQSTVRVAAGETTHTLVCSLRSPTLHVYVNGRELVVADQLGRTLAAYYGQQTVVRVREIGRSYRVSVVTLLPQARIGVRLTTPTLSTLS